MPSEQENPNGYLEFSNNQKQKLTELIAHGDQSAIIQFLADNEEFRKKQISAILSLIPKGRLRKVIIYLEAQYQIDLKNTRGRVTINPSDPQNAQELTHFNDFVTSGGKLDKEGYLAYLEEQRLPSSLLNRIIIHRGINYEDLSGNRYLQNLIEQNSNNDYTVIILQFIGNASREELNASDSEGRTALVAAEVSRLHCLIRQNQEIQPKQDIINALLIQGADALQNDNRSTPCDSLNSRSDEGSVDQSITYNESLTKPRPPESAQKNIKKIAKNSSSNSKALTALVIGAAALFYVGYKILNNEKIAKISTTKQ